MTLSAFFLVTNQNCARFLKHCSFCKSRKFCSGLSGVAVITDRVREKREVTEKHNNWNQPQELQQSETKHKQKKNKKKLSNNLWNVPLARKISVSKLFVRKSLAQLCRSKMWFPKLFKNIFKTAQPVHYT